MNTFNFCGKIALGKETEKFKPVDKKVFDSGWTSLNVRFNCISDTNRVMCTVQGGKWSDDAKNSVKTFSKSTTDESGNVTKGTNIEIPWVKRFDKDQIARVAGFRKFVCDIGDTKERYKLQDLVKALKKGDATDAMIEEFGINDLATAEAALEKSQAKKKEFLTEWDFAEYLVKVCNSDKMKDKKFYISGTYDVQYNPVNDRFYTSYHVNRVILAPDDAEPSTKMEIDFFFGENAFDDSVYEETGKCFVNGWVTYYDNNKEVRKNGFMPITIAVREDEKKVKGFKRKFDIDEGIKQIGLTLKVVEGAERQEITIEMLDEETRTDIECGLADFEEIKRKLGGNTFGDKVSELRFEKLTANKNIVQDTVYTLEDMRPAKKENIEQNVVEEVINDMFDDEVPF